MSGQTISQCVVTLDNIKKLESVNDSQRATAEHTQLITGRVRDSPPYLLSLEPDFGLMVNLNNTTSLKTIITNVPTS